MVEKHWKTFFNKKHWKTFKHWKTLILFFGFGAECGWSHWILRFTLEFLRFTLEFSDLRWNSQIYVEFLNILLIWYVSLCCSMLFNVLNVFVALCFSVRWWLNGFKCLFFFKKNVYAVFQYCSICFNAVLWFNVYCWL